MQLQVKNVPTVQVTRLVLATADELVGEMLRRADHVLAQCAVGDAISDHSLEYFIDMLKDVFVDIKRAWVRGACDAMLIGRPIRMCRDPSSRLCVKVPRTSCPSRHSTHDSHRR